MIRNICCLFFAGGLALSTAYAGEFGFDTASSRLTSPPTASLTQSSHLRQAAAFATLEIPSAYSEPRKERDLLESLAEDLSYFGAILLTAHEILVSVQSWTDILEFRGSDGSQIELTKTPKGMGVMVLIKIPLD